MIRFLIILAALSAAPGTAQIYTSPTVLKDSTPATPGIVIVKAKTTAHSTAPTRGPVSATTITGAGTRSPDIASAI